MRKHRINLKKFDIVEEDGVVVYDESDDYDPGEDEDVEGGEFRLPYPKKSLPYAYRN